MIVGIDLGTTNSRVAIIQPEIRQPVAPPINCHKTNNVFLNIFINKRNLVKADII
jgi:molecular chaperone DnaK (HSP70)